MKFKANNPDTTISSISPEMNLGSSDRLVPVIRNIAKIIITTVTIFKARKKQ